VRVLVDYRSALRGRSGVGEYLHQLVAALLAMFPSSASPRQLDMTVFSSSWKDRLTPSSELDGVKAVDLRVPVSVLNLAWHRLGWPPVELLAGGAAFDVTHSGHPLLLPARHAARVITIHDLNFLAHPERTRAEIRRDYPGLTRAHARRADAVIVSSRFTAAEVERQLGLAADRIAVCPPGAPDWTPRPALPDAGYVLFVGTLEPRKNVGTLLDAYERLLARRAMPPLVLAGQATAESRLWLDRIGRAPLAGHVRHIGYVDPSALRALYEGARVLIQPSFEEGFGLPVLEAMTIGVPVVAADRGALPEVLGDAGLLVDPLQADAMASGLERMLDDIAFASSCAARGARRAREFRWSDTAARVYRVYQLAMERRAERVLGAHRD
jgi:glycosyltransferase involved in cell wall biosynthesis